MAVEETASKDAYDWMQKVTRPEISNIHWDFSGHVVLVTGAARSQGRSHALSFARAGATVVLADICQNLSSVRWSLGSKEELDETTKECQAQGVDALPVVCDVRDSAQVEKLVAEAIANFGKIDVLVNNAAIYPHYSLFDLSEEAWDECLDTGLKGVFLCSKAVAKHMVQAGRGKIVSTGSTTSVLGAPRYAHYVSAKHGVAGLTKAMAIDLARHGINVNCVCPGGVYTPHNMQAMRQASDNGAEPEPDPGPNVWDLGGTWSLFNDECLHPEDISNAIMFLASDAARYITGQVLCVDQGFSIK
jgi:NAD(P)-dependent dehydrogenase (short-subunit alcohol dehydrogenase family)